MMPKGSVCKILGILFGGMFSLSQADAAIITINETLDLESFSNPVFMTNIGIAPVTISQGDSVVLNIDFLGNQKFHVNQGGNQRFFLSAPISLTYGIDNTQITRHVFGGPDTTGSAFFFPNPSPSFGPVFGLPTGIFTGFTVSYDVVSLASPVEFARLDIINDSQNLAVSSVPLPASFPLFAGGVAAFGLLVRRRGRRLQ